jgi:hypothetical protein
VYVFCVIEYLCNCVECSFWILGLRALVLRAVVRGLCKTSWIIHNLDCCLFSLVSVVTYLHDTHSNVLCLAR